MKSPTTYKSWFQNLSRATNSLQKAQQTYDDYNCLTPLVKDTKVETLYDLRNHLVDEIEDKQRLLNRGEKVKGVLKGLDLAVQIIDRMISENR